jgi:hypothetical protein
MPEEKPENTPTFLDKKSRKWTLSLDPILVDDIAKEHGVNLVDLKKDPLITLRSDPMKLVCVVAMICDEARQEQQIDERDFGRAMPFPPDPMIEALQAAIVDFFPTGQASHVREVLAEMETMAQTTDRLMLEQVRQVTTSPSLATSLSSRAKSELERLVAEICNPTSAPLTSKSTDAISSS